MDIRLLYNINGCPLLRLDSFNSAFSKTSGLYISKLTRISLFEFRDFISKELLEPYEETNNSALSKEQISRFKNLRTAARLALRNEVGSENITIANEEYRIN